MLQTVLQVVWGLTPRAGERCRAGRWPWSQETGWSPKALGTRASLLQAWEPWQFSAGNEVMVPHFRRTSAFKMVSGS